MQTCWIRQQNRASCILFFAGWGMDQTPFSLLSCDRHDMLICYDYRELAKPGAVDLLLDRYRDLYLIAWSMGVWAAGTLLGGFQDRFTAAFAVNGTVTPIDDRCGIEEKAFTRMIEGFSTPTLEKFYHSMFEDERETTQFFNNLPQRLPAEIRDELIALRTLYSDLGPAPDIFSHRLIGSRDRVFTARAQLRSWGRENCTILQVPHFPFYRWPDWADFLNEAVTS